MWSIRFCQACIMNIPQIMHSFLYKPYLNNGVYLKLKNFNCSSIILHILHKNSVNKTIVL